MKACPRRGEPTSRRGRIACAQLSWWSASGASIFVAGLGHGSRVGSPADLFFFAFVWTAWGTLVSTLLLLLARRVRLTSWRLGSQVLGAGLGALLGATGFCALILPMTLRDMGPHDSPIGVVIFVTVMFSAWASAALVIAMTERARNAERLALELEVEMVESEIRGLRQQVNSHLVFNALNSILVAVEEKSERAPEMILDLSKLLRLSLEKHQQVGNFAEEEERLQLFVRIVRARFEDELDIALDLPAELRDFRCLPLIVQPLVENAVKHGQAPQGGALRVSCVAEREGENVVVKVSNHGTLAEPGKQGAGTGIGVESVRKRLLREYGDRASLDIAEQISNEGPIVVAVLRFPLELAEPDSADSADGEPGGSND